MKKTEIDSAWGAWQDFLSDKFSTNSPSLSGQRHEGHAHNRKTH